MSLPTLKLYHKDTYPTISLTRPELSQENRTVLVAGASSGIGFSIAHSFAKAKAGRVIILGRQQDRLTSALQKLQREMPANVFDARTVDISSRTDVETLWSNLQSENIFVDVMVLNAASFGQRMSILANGAREVWEDFEVNVRGPLDMTSYFYKQTTGHGQKFLVNVSTIAAYMWTTIGSDHPSYGLTKNAGTALMQQIAKDTQSSDMQIVSFHPGSILTDAMRKNGPANFSDLKLDHEDLPGHFAVWAASPEAAFLHGRFVWANWDMDEVKNGPVGKRIAEDEHFLKVGIEGLTEKSGGLII